MKFAQLLPLLLATVAQAATLDVTTNADSGVGSLRAQIATALSGDTVAITATGTIALTTGEIAITGKNLSISGPGANSLVITTNATTRALKIVNAQRTISGITFSNCKGLPGDVDTGGAIAVDNFTSGGASYVTTVNDCAFTNNQSGWGGALSLGPTTASSITNCTFSANMQTSTAASQLGGGAVFNYGATFANPPAVTFEHCTFVGNVDASVAAGAIRGNYTGSYHTAARLKNCLLVNNQAPASVLKNFAGNATGSLTTSYASLGGNVTDEAATSAQFMAANIDKVSPPTLAASLSPTLAFNGGVLPTHAITRGSPAQRSGLTSSVATDQRGAPRHAKADAGAFELIEPELSVTIATVPVSEGGTIAFGSTPFDTPLAATVTITNTQTSPFTTGPLQLAIEVSGDLSSPTAWSTAETTVEANTLTTLQARDNAPVAGAPMRFIRLNATRP